MVMASPRAPDPPPSACNTLSAPAAEGGGGAAGGGAIGANGGGPPTGGTPTAPPSDATSATTAGGDTTSEEAASKAALAEPVLRCLRALEAAESDTEKLAALFLVPKLVKGGECDKTARLCLMKVEQTFDFPFVTKTNFVFYSAQGIGFSFLARMLRSKDSPDGCPRLMYQSVALSVLSCFASSNDEEIATNASLLFNLPVLLDIVTDADNPAYEENLLVKREKT